MGIARSGHMTLRAGFRVYSGHELPSPGHALGWAYGGWLNVVFSVTFQHFRGKRCGKGGKYLSNCLSERCFYTLH